MICIDVKRILEIVLICAIIYLGYVAWRNILPQNAYVKAVIQTSHITYFPYAVKGSSFVIVATPTYACVPFP
jgi:hypothetical protein